MEIITENAKINIYEMKSLEGCAEVAVRKGKQIFQFDYQGEVYWKAQHTTDDRQECSGKLKFYEVNQEDDELQVEVTNERESEWAMAVKKSLRTTVADAMLE